jgi:hypothetical protein
MLVSSRMYDDWPWMSIWILVSSVCHKTGIPSQHLWALTAVFSQSRFNSQHEERLHDMIRRSYACLWLSTETRCHLMPWSNWEQLHTRLSVLRTLHGWTSLKPAGEGSTSQIAELLSETQCMPQVTFETFFNHIQSVVWNISHEDELSTNKYLFSTLLTAR